MTKKLFPGLLSAIAEGIPALIGFVKPLIKKKKTPIEVLETMPKEQLVDYIKGNESKDDETWYAWVLKRAVTLATIYFVVWAAKKMGVTYQDIMNLFGLIN